MKILQVITKSSLGGAQSVVINLANALSEMGHEVGVVAGEGDGKLWTLLNDKVKKYPCASLKRSISPKNDMHAVWFMRRLYNAIKPDVVHLHSSKAGMLGRVAFPKSKVIYTVHGFDSIRLAFRKFLPIERAMQHFCSAIIGVSEHDVRTMKEERICRNVHYVYNGIQQIEKDNSLSWEVPNSYKKVVLCIARLSPPKKHDLFMEVAKNFPEYAFVWIGNQKTVEQHPDNVFFLGKIPNAGKYCHLADVLMLPSNYEGLPMVILEAMCQGVPVVASNVGGVSEVVKNGWNGFCVENSVEKFVSAIQTILEDPCLHVNMKNNALKCYNNHFTVKQMVDGYLYYYNRICKR